MPTFSNDEKREKGFVVKFFTKKKDFYLKSSSKQKFIEYFTNFSDFRTPGRIFFKSFFECRLKLRTNADTFNEFRANYVFFSKQNLSYSVGS